MGELDSVPSPSSFVKQGKVILQNGQDPVARVDLSGQGSAPVAVAEIIAAKPKRTARRAPTPKQMKAAKLISENISSDKPKSQGEILREAGYSETQSKRPGDIIQADSFQDLLDQVMPDNDLATIHKRLLQTRKIEHMVFPLMIDEAEESILNEGQTLKITNGQTLTDDDICEMLLEVNCQVKKIMHSETARHVWYWAHDANAQTKALELVYKLKGHLNKDNGAGGDVLNLNLGVQNFVKQGGTE